MPSLDLNQSLLSAGADYRAGDWLSAGASADLAINAGARLERGLDLELGIGVMGSLDAAFRKFLAADLQARAQASARLKGQVQVPIDLFGEAGLAVRLQAVAEAGASVRLAIGLSIGDFIALAQTDPHIQGVALELLIIFLEELNIQAGVLGKVAYSAMAYVNLVITGRLIEMNTVAGSLPAGFTVAGEYGVGLEGGYGCQFFANLGFKDNRRLIRRSVDVAVDATLRELAPHLTDDNARHLLFSLRAPAKIALRAAFEIGLSLTEQLPSLLADSSPELARRALIVAFEESQRVLLELFAQLAVGLFKEALTALGAAPNAWENSRPQREALAALLNNFPDDAFALSAANAAYWLNLVQSAGATAVALGGPELIDAEWVRPLSILYAASQLMAAALNRVNDGSVRGAFLGSFAVEVQIPPFLGNLQGAPPPDLIAEHLRSRLGLAAGTALRQEHMADYLTQDVLLELLVDTFPAASPFLEVLAGPQNIGLVAAARVMLTNLGAFVPDPANPGSFDPVESLRVIAGGLDAYVDARVEAELKPLLHAAVQHNPDLVLYMDDVLIATLKFTSGTLLDKVINWTAGQVGTRDAVRQACSSVVMKLLGRSLVVTADVLMDYSLQQMSATLEDLAGHVNDPDGLAEAIAELPGSPFDRPTAAELLSETLLIAAEVFDPLPDETRARIRALLYDVVDTLPPDADAGWVEQLKQDFFVPNEAEVMALAGELGDSLLEKMGRFLTTVLARVAEIVLAEMGELVEAVAEQVAAYLTELAQVVAELYARLLALPGEIAAALEEAGEAFDDALAGVEDFLADLIAYDARLTLRNTLRSQVNELALEVLTDLPGYTLLNSDVRAAARASLSAAVGTVVGTDLFDPLLAGLDAAAETAAEWTAELRDLAADLGELDPDANLSAQVQELLLDRVENVLREALGNDDPGLPIAFSFTFEFYPPKVWGPISWANGVPVEYGWVQPPPIVETFSFDLGTVEVPLDDLIALARAAFEGLAFVEECVREIADALVDHLAALLQVEALQVEQYLVTVQHAAAEEQMAAARPARGSVNLTILSPVPGALYESAAPVEIALSGVTEALLGLGRLEQERLFVWLNETPIAPDDFVVEVKAGESGPAPTGIELPGRRATLRLRTVEAGREDPALDAVLPEGRFVLQPGPGTAGWSRPLPGRPAHTAAEARAGGRQPAGGRSLDPAALESARRKLNAPGAQWRADGRSHGLRAEVSRPKTGKPGRGPGWKAPELGRPLRESERAAVLEALQPTLVVHLDLPPETLRQGFNSLHVALVDGNHLRLEQTVVFLAASPLPAEGGGRGTRPLGRVVWTLDDLPPAWSELAGLVGTREPAREGRATSGASRPDGPISAGSPYWLPPAAERKKTRAASRRSTTQRLNKTQAALAEARNAVREGKLRPVPQVRDAAGNLQPLPKRRRPLKEKPR